jgi:hypothetical protein
MSWRCCARPASCALRFGVRDAPEGGYLRIVFLASTEDLRDIFALMAQFTADYLRA